MQYKIIDSHIHFWDLANGYNDWVKGTVLPSIVTPVGLDADMFIHIEAHSDKFDALCEYHWLKSNFSNTDIKVVATADFTQSIDIFRSDILKLSEVKDIVGVRQIMSKTTKTNYSPFDKDIPKDLKEKLSILKEYDLVFDAQMYPEQYLPLLDAIDSSGVTMAIEHFGLPIFAGNDNLSEWKTFIKQVSQNDNWYMKISGFDLNNSMRDINKCLDFIFDNISTRKLCYGSNFPVSHQNDYNNWKGFLVEYINNNSVIKDVFFNVANKVYLKGDF